MSQRPHRLRHGRRDRCGAAVAGPGIRAAIAAITVWLWSGGSGATAWALCPNCLGQTRALTPTLELLGGFLLLPFIVSYVVLRVIRRACRDVSPSRPPAGA